MPTLATSSVGKAAQGTSTEPVASFDGRETVKTVTRISPPLNSQLKLGVNERGEWRTCAVIIGLLLLALASPAQKLDQNANGMSDVWEQIYGAAGLTPNGDNDGDGVSNAQEAMAGTSPF